MSIYLWGLFHGHDEISRIHEYAQDHLLDYFPKLPAYATRLNRLDSAFEVLVQCLQRDYPILEGVLNIGLIDSMPIVMAKGSRRYTAKVAPEIASSGYCSTKKLHYYGIKLHMIAFKRIGKLPIPDYIGISGGGDHDIKILKHIAHELDLPPIFIPPSG